MPQVHSIRDQLDSVVATGVPGAVAVAVGPDVRVEVAAGFADLRTGEVLTVDDRFRIGSVTKIFVSALVLQLVAEGLLDLDGDAAPFAEGITIRQLLNHTSGLQDWVGDIFSDEPSYLERAHCLRVISNSTSPCPTPSTGAVMVVGKVRT